MKPEELKKLVTHNINFLDFCVAAVICTLLIVTDGKAGIGLGIVYLLFFRD